MKNNSLLTLISFTISNKKRKKDGLLIGFAIRQLCKGRVTVRSSYKLQPLLINANVFHNFHSLPTNSIKKNYIVSSSPHGNHTKGRGVEKVLLRNTEGNRKDV